MEHIVKEGYPESDLLPISALQHLIYCERQCALIHIEQVWDENRSTAEGRTLHDKAHQSGSETRPGIRIARDLAIRSLRLGLSGKPDVVEFHLIDQEELDRTGDRRGIALQGAKGRWRPFPVEYKRGRPKSHSADLVQLCAQAVCLEEMLGCEVPSGALFYGKIRRRMDVTFVSGLRDETEAASVRLHALFASGVTPPAQYSSKCDECSLLSFCLPEIGLGTGSVDRYLRNALTDLDV